MTGQTHAYIPAMGKHWLLPLYDPFTRLARVGRIHGQLLDRADVRGGQRILEIGCGTGNLLTALGQRKPGIKAADIKAAGVGAAGIKAAGIEAGDVEAAGIEAAGIEAWGVEAVGIDPDPAALRRARRKAARRNLPIRYEQGFAGELPLPDASFDRVLSAFMLHHLDAEERLRAFREVRRVLRPGGRLHVVDVDGTPSGRAGGRKAHRNPRVEGSRPEMVLAAMSEAGLTGVAENGREQARFGGYVFYRAEK
jgi:ubiquinone/menaquinone biosynthesis C-methylase UbiE